MNSPVSSTIRDALQGQTLEGFDAAQFEALGAKLYYSLGSAMNQVDIHTMVQTFRSVHAPAYGQFIPQSGAWTEDGVGNSLVDLISPSNNEVYGVGMIGLLNPTLGSLDITITLWDILEEKSVVISEQTLTAGEEKALSPTLFGGTLLIDSNAKLTAIASGDNVTVTTYSHKVVQ